MTEILALRFVLVPLALLCAAPALSSDPNSATGEVADCRAAIADLVPGAVRPEGLAGLEATRRVVWRCDRDSIPPALRVEALLLGTRLPELDGARKLEIAEKAESLLRLSKESAEFAYRVSEELSLAHFLLGNHEEAIRRLRQAWEERQDQFGYGSQEEIEGQLNLAAGYLSLAELASDRAQLELARREAESAYTRALSSFGRGHRATVEAAIGLRAILERLGEGDRARRIWDEQISPFIGALASEEDLESEERGSPAEP